MTTIATLVVKLVGEVGDYLTQMEKADEMTQSFSGRAMSGLSSLGGSIVVGALAAGTAAVTGLGVAAWTAGETMDEAMDIIATKTGATGEALSALGGVFEDVFAQVPNQAGAAADVIASLNTRLGLTGDSLEATSVQMLNMTNLLGGDATTNAQLFSRAMGDWGVPLADSGTLMDKLFVASQSTGTSVESLMTNIVQFGAPMRNMNFSVDEAIALFAKWEKEGVNAELVMGSLRQAAGKFADQNIPLREGLEGTMAAIKGAATSSEALAIAMDIFGARAAGDMSAAIREGRFSIDDLVAALGNAEGAINKTAAATADWPEQWAKLSNTITVALAPIGDVLRGIAAQAIEAMGAFLAKPEVQQFLTDLAANIAVWGAAAAEWIPQIVAWFQGFSDWLNNNQGVVVAVLAMIGVAILAFAYTSLAAAIPIVIAFVVAWWPVIAVLALVGLAAYVLYTAWTENWGGIQEKTAAVLEFLRPIFEKIVEWFKTNIPLALQAVVDFWNTTLLPAFVEMAAWLTTNIPIAIQAVSGWFTNTLIPAIQAVWSWISTHLFPLFKELGELLSFGLGPSIADFASSWDKVKGPLMVVAGIIEKNLVWQFNNLKSILEFIGPYIGEYVTWAFGNLTGIIDGITAAIKLLNDALNQIKLPDDLTPGSPTPFEMGLRGIGSALDALNGTQLPTFQAGLELQPMGVGALANVKAGALSGGGGRGGAGGGGQTFVVQYVDNAVISTARENEIIDKLGPALYQYLRQQKVI